MIDQMRTANHNGRTRLARAALIGLASLGLAGTLIGATASSTMAFNPNQPNGYLAGFGVNVGAHVVCDDANHRMWVSAEAMVMTAQGTAGPMPGPYDAGQYLRYNVFVREVGQADWWPIYSWSPWIWTTTRASSRATSPSPAWSTSVRPR